ncbi:MAG: hypothetical protein MZU97_10765 [Bacillus subtilis]|nr:hypothetical protein [Bacillus subtilis]
MARNYFSDIESGYMFNKYIDDSVEPPKKIYNLDAFGLKDADSDAAAYGHNKINGYNIDYGGFNLYIPGGCE